MPSRRFPLNVLLRWGVFALACALLVQHLLVAQGTPGMASTSVDWDLRVWALLPVVVALGAFNWWLESRKWKLLLRGIAAVDGMGALRATLTGTAVGLITPNRTGEFLGRIAHLPSDVRSRAAFASIPGSVAQFAVTLAAGAFGILLLMVTGKALPWTGIFPATVVLLPLAFSIGIVLVLLFRPRWTRSLLLGPAFMRRFRSASVAMVAVEPSVARQVLALSMLRYGTFTLQFVLLLMALAPELGVLSAWGAVPVVFLITSLVPTAMLTELGVRGSVAVALLVPLHAEAWHVVSASFVLWAVNLALPALLGAVILLFARVRRPVVLA
ncbi:MAG: flippase-like domain-containing protein [Flavobacteriales bacterium]|nr:flippase-like domain-containing protein [Flavobacteriales bacterium]